MYFNYSEPTSDIFEDTTRELQYTASSTWNGTHAVTDGKVYAYITTPLCAVTEKKEVIGADATSFKYIGDGYAKDASNVYYLNDGDVCSKMGGKVSILQDADPASFTLKKYPEVNDTFSLGADSDSVYFDSTFLKGINPLSMRTEQHGNIIRDEDTVWLNGGNCHVSEYREGSLSELSSYEPPC